MTSKSPKKKTVLEQSLEEALKENLPKVAQHLRRQIEAEKAGLLELADLIVVNKSDLDGSDKVVNDLTMSLTLTSDAPPIIKTSTITGEGLDDLSAMITQLEERTSSKRARHRQQLLMAHENIITSNPHFEPILDRMSEEGLALEDALRELSE